MIRNETLKILEFDKILSTIAGFARSSVSRQQIISISPGTDRSVIATRFDQVEEIRRLLQQRLSLPISAFGEIRKAISDLRPQGKVLDAGELLVFVPVLQNLSSISRHFAYREDIPRLKELAGDVTGFPDLEDEFAVCLDGEGNILDSASPALYEIRSRKRSLSERIRRRLEEIVRDRQVTPFLQDDFITMRSGRWVIPVRMDAKGQVPGVMHDVSGSGETAFVEPLEIIGLANELENLSAEEKAEEIRILRELCRQIRGVADDLERQFEILVQLDLLDSLAHFAEEIGGNVPAVEEDCGLMIAGGRHPLLVLLHRQGKGKAPVPLDVSLGAADKIMVITGPNAGGKTIAIKTIGLLLVMTLSGIPVPASSSSSFPLIYDLFVDMGDDQSIETSLSTFSAHAARVADILQRVDGRSMVLLDELGTGTEPVQGAALACAVLQDLHAKGAVVFATTHLTDIVGFVHRTTGMKNASMEFDKEKLMPLYRLRVGEPGQSHALQIARRYGMPEHVIDAAEGMLGRMEREFHALLGELKEQHKRQELLETELKRRLADIQDRENKIATRLADVDQRRREELEKAYSEARQVIAQAKREVREIVEEAKKERTRTSLKKLEEADQLAAEQLRQLSPEPALSIDDLAEGERVLVSSLGREAVVVKVDRRQERVRVLAGNVEMEVPFLDLVSRRKGVQKKVSAPRISTAAPEEESTSLNVVGQRVDEALGNLEPFLNQASLNSIGEVKIIHGVGKGILAKAVRECLARHPLVISFRRGEQFEGGEGVTFVSLR